MNALSVVRKFFQKVRRVVDATENVRIEVTAADAAASAKGDHAHCAMAVACKRSFHLDGVIISRSKAYLIKGTVARRFDVPDSVAREVVSFDRGGGFAPGFYSLSRIGPQGRLGVRQNPNKNRSGKSSQRPRFRHLTKKVRAVLGGAQPEGETK